ncbi:ligase [Bifidobacterium eulemuris]|nr:ligase [Bifidobacterium eulemuris]
MTSCRIDGDFFIEGTNEACDALLRDLERALICGEPVGETIARHNGARLVGTDAQAIETAFARATNQSGYVHGTAGHGADDSRGTIVHDANGYDTNASDMWKRWEALARELVVVRDHPRLPAEQMAIDERWAREVAAGTRPATLRFWEWAAPCVVIGRFQSEPDEVNLDVARELGFSVVRRCTGGGAMFIEPGNTLTYSLYAPLWFVEGIDIEESYRLCDHWLVETLRKLNIDVRFSGLNDIASQSGKIGGAAQRRFPRPRMGCDGALEDAGRGMGAVLHHVTLSYDIDARKMSRVLNTSREKMSDKAVKSAVKRVDPLKRQTGLTREELVDYLIGEFGVPGREDDLI